MPPEDFTPEAFAALQRRLQESVDRFRTLTENAFDLICEVDERGVFRYLSPNYFDVLGWDVDARIGKLSLDFVHPQQREFVEQRLRQAAVEGSGFAEFQIQAGDGAWHWIETTGQAYRTAEGELRFVVISRDVTARREAQERLRQEQEFQRRLLDLQDADRRLMAFEIHDGLVQDIYGAKLFLDSIQLDAPADSHERKSLASAVHLLAGAIEEARRLINGLRPPILDEQGLVAALEHLAQEMEQTYSIRVDLHADVPARALAATVENAVFRVVQECLSNVRKHAGVNRASIRVTHEQHAICIAAADRGRGFDPSAVPKKSYGLEGIRERARLLGGEFHLRSEPGRGTEITVRLPLVETSEDDLNDRPRRFNLDD